MYVISVVLKKRSFSEAGGSLVRGTYIEYVSGKK